MQEHFVDVVKIVRPLVFDIATKNPPGLGHHLRRARRHRHRQHAVGKVTTFSVTFFPARTANATLVGTDPSKDLAVIKVDVPSSAPAPGTFADSGRRPAALTMPSHTLLSRPTPSNTEKSVADRLISATDR